VKIDNSTKSVTAPQGSPARARSSAPAGSAAGSAAGTQVQISPASTQLQAADGVADTARIAEIKQAIAEGRFQINADRIADGLLDSVRQMLGQQGN